MICPRAETLWGTELGRFSKKGIQAQGGQLD